MKIRDYIGAISRAASESDSNRNIRGLITGAARLAKTNSSKFLDQLSGMSAIARIEEDELARWVDPGEIKGQELNGQTRRFDVCDLRIWLELAKDAGIEAIPATTIATLSEDELGSLLGKMNIPQNLRTRIAEGVMSDRASDLSSEAEQDISSMFDEVLGISKTPDEDLRATAFSKVEGAMDEIPSSWMVRTHIAGSGNLKALVGCGLMQKGDDTAKVRDGLEIGGGWVRAGNRRMIDFSDPRFLSTAIGGHKTDVHYLARPWAEAGRFHKGEDLHRANTPLAGEGLWPAEWRVFVRSGQVTGVANYYGWTGEGASAENAWNAIEAAAAAQQIVDLAEDRNLAGIFMEQVFLRKTRKHEEVADLLDRNWPEDRMHCTLDFLETKDGLRFLEAGPGHLPGGGGHPCAFAGQGIDQNDPLSISSCEGVAYKNMPHVHLGEVSTWVNGDADGCIESWVQAAERGFEYAPFSERAIEFLEQMSVDEDLDPEVSF